MGRKRLRLPPPPPAAVDPALLEAVKGALAALAAARKEATPSDIEEWIKTNQYAVWSAITTASALKAAIEAARREGGAGRPDTTPKGARGMGRKKKVEQTEPASVAAAKPEPPAAANGDGRETPAPPARKARTRPEADTDPTPARAARPRKARAKRKPPAPATTAASAPAPSKPRPPVAAGHDPTRSELLRVLQIAREQGGVGKLTRLVLTVKALADQVGGLDRLAVCLDTLDELGVK